MFPQSSLQADVLARDIRNDQLIRSTSLAQIRIALADSEVAGALFRVALCLAAAAREPETKNRQNRNPFDGGASPKKLSK